MYVSQHLHQLHYHPHRQQVRTRRRGIWIWEMNRISEGYKQAVDKIWSFGNKRIFGPKTEISGPKNMHFWGLTMFWPQPGKVVQTKSTLFQNKYQSLSNFFLLEINDFLAKRKNGHFSVILAGTKSVVIVGHFFDGPDGPTKFR